MGDRSAPFDLKSHQCLRCQFYSNLQRPLEVDWSIPLRFVRRYTEAGTRLQFYRATRASSAIALVPS